MGRTASRPSRILHPKDEPLHRPRRRTGSSGLHVILHSALRRIGPLNTTATTTEACLFIHTQYNNNNSSNNNNNMNKCPFFCSLKKKNNFTTSSDCSTFSNVLVSLRSTTVPFLTSASPKVSTISYFSNAAEVNKLGNCNTYSHTRP